MASNETVEHRTRRAAVVLASFSLASLVSLVTLSAGCNVYDASLLDAHPSASGGTSGGSILVGNGATHSGGAHGSYAGEDAAAGSLSHAGGSNAAGDSGTGIGGGPGAVAGAGSSGSSSTGAGAAGDPPEVGGGSSAGAGNPTLSMIDDMENADQYIPLTDSRVGFWTLTTDSAAGGTKTPSPVMIMSAIPGGRGASTNGLHTTTSGFGTRPVLNVDLNRKGSTRDPYNASAYKAVHFWAKVLATTNTGVHFAILDQHTDPGGGMCCPTDKCMTGSIENGLCYDHFAEDVTLTSAWQEYTVEFAKMNQVGWGDNPSKDLDAAHVFALQLDWDVTAMDLWLDDIAFVKK